MKKIFFLFLFSSSTKFLAAQERTAWKEPSKESEAYHKYREKITIPPYALQKIKELISKAGYDDDGNKLLNEEKYALLSLKEKFTYNMIHAESYSQNCDAMPLIQDEQKKIFAQLPDAFGEFDWSDRQKDFFKANRDSVIEWMKASVLRTNRVGVNYKEVMVMINAKEIVPLLIKTYRTDKKDHDILTVLMLLMKENNCSEFLNSSSYKKLYADDESSYRAFLLLSSANEELIIKRAGDCISK